MSHLDLSLSIDQTGRDVDLALYVAIKELIKTETELSKLYDEVTEAIRNYSSKDQTGGFKQTLSACWEKVKAKESDIEDHVRVINKVRAGATKIPVLKKTSERKIFTAVTPVCSLSS